MGSQFFRRAPRFNGVTCLLCDLELNGCARFLLNDFRSASDFSAHTQIGDTQPKKIASPKLAIDGKIEQS